MVYTSVLEHSAMDMFGSAAGGVGALPSTVVFWDYSSYIEIGSAAAAALQSPRGRSGTTTTSF